MLIISTNEREELSASPIFYKELLSAESQGKYWIIGFIVLCSHLLKRNSQTISINHTSNDYIKPMSGFLYVWRLTLFNISFSPP